MLNITQIHIDSSKIPPHVIQFTLYLSVLLVIICAASYELMYPTIRIRFQVMDTYV